ADQWTTFVTFPARMQLVQTCSRRGAPSTRARTRWMFGFHRRLVRRCEWLTLMPHDGRLPHTSQTAAMTGHLGGRARTGPGDSTGAAAPATTPASGPPRRRPPPGAPGASPTIVPRDSARPAGGLRPAGGGARVQGGVGRA